MALRRAIIKTIDTKRPIQRLARRVLSTEAAPKEKQERQTHFGFQTVDEEEKWKKGMIYRLVKNDFTPLWLLNSSAVQQLA